MVKEFSVAGSPKTTWDPKPGDHGFNKFAFQSPSDCQEGLIPIRSRPDKYIIRLARTLNCPEQSALPKYLIIIWNVTTLLIKVSNLITINHKLS